jgi:hypothetical protein
LPDDWIAFCEAERPDLNPYDTGKRFVDYWTAKTGQNATKLDWFATWRNWVRDEKARASAGSKAFGESFRERDERVARERAEEFMGRPQRKKPEADVVIDVTPVFFELDHEA